MAGTIPGTIIVPEGRFRRVRGASGGGFFDPDFAELLLKNNRSCKIPLISTSLFVDPDFAELLAKNNRSCEIPLISTSLF